MILAEVVEDMNISRTNTERIEDNSNRRYTENTKEKKTCSLAG